MKTKKIIFSLLPIIISSMTMSAINIALNHLDSCELAESIIGDSSLNVKVKLDRIEAISSGGEKFNRIFIKEGRSSYVKRHESSVQLLNNDNNIQINNGNNFFQFDGNNYGYFVYCVDPYSTPKRIYLRAISAFCPIADLFYVYCPTNYINDVSSAFGSFPGVDKEDVYNFYKNYPNDAIIRVDEDKIYLKLYGYDTKEEIKGFHYEITFINDNSTNIMRGDVRLTLQEIK